MNRFITLSGLALLGGCSIPQPGSPEAQLLMLKAQHDIKVQSAQSSVGDAPSWYMKPPADDATVLYASASAVSSDMDFALSKATLYARANLGARLGSKLSSQMKGYMAESGGSLAKSHAERAINDVVAEVDMAGVITVEQKVVAVDGQYRAYSLVRLPLAPATQSLAQKVDDDEMTRAEKESRHAFNELAKETKAAAAEPPLPLAAPQIPVTKEDSP